METDRVTEELLPSLFWRIDEAEQVGSLSHSSLSIYREDVLRSLKWLLNASAHPARSPIHDYPHVEKSVLNFGLPPTTGRVGSSLDVEKFVRDLKRVIVSFEERIVAKSLEVEVLGNQGAATGPELTFQISGSIRCEPLPEHFSFKTHIDTASGNWIFD